MPYASELPGVFQSGEEMVSYTQVHRVFSATAEGKTLAARIRFLRFKPPVFSDSQWAETLGDDGDRLKHCFALWRASKKFLFQMMEEGKECSEEDAVSLQLACLMHDWSGTEADDLAFSPLTTQGRFVDVSAVLERTMAPPLQARLASAAERTFAETGSFPWQAFLALEGLSHGELILWAWKKGGAIKGAYQEWFRYFALRLFTAGIPSLLAQADVSPVKAWLLAHRETLEAIASLSDADIRYFPPDGYDRSLHPKGFILAFDAARDAWENGRII